MTLFVIYRILGPLLPTIRTSLPSAEKHVAPIVKRREQQIELLGDEYERPVSGYLELKVTPDLTGISNRMIC